MSLDADLTIAQASVHLRTGAISPIHLVEGCLARIARLNSSINGFLYVDAERALNAAAAAATEIANGRWRGPVHGIPIGIKDIIHVAGMPTTANSKVLPGAVAKQNATVVDSL